MRIQHNIAAMNANRQLGINNNSVSKNLEKLSSGYKINRAGDDAAGLAISEKMRSQIRGLDQASNNANDGISLIQTAEGALNETASILLRMKELATQSSNGTYQDAVDRTNIQAEITSLTSEIDRISSSTNFNKKNLLDGSVSVAASGITFQIGDQNVASQQVTLTIGAMDATSLALTSVSLGSQTSAQAALSVIDAAINTVSTQRANLGAVQNRLEHTVNNLGVTSENLSSAESRIRDVDMASEMMALTKNQVLAQAAQSMLAQANTQPQSVLKLLQ